MSATEPMLMIVTDLDGTLLDHETYSFAPAEQALSLIAKRNYPLILNSSKTRVEILALQQELGLQQPFICENGAAVFLPHGGEWQCQAFARPRDEWLDRVYQLRDTGGYPFRGFSDWSNAELAAMTGLSRDQATLAAQREYSEPLQWFGSDELREEFAQELWQHDLRLIAGGRFYSLQGRYDKAGAMQWLKQYYQQQGPVITVALGDSHNDLAMLNAAEIAVLIKSAQSDGMLIEGPQRVIRTKYPGPEGWQQAITEVIDGLDHGVFDIGGKDHG